MKQRDWWTPLNELFDRLAAVGIHNQKDLDDRWRKIQEELSKGR